MAGDTLIFMFFCTISFERVISFPPGFANFLASVEQLLDDIRRLENTNSVTVVESIVGRLQCAVDTTYQVTQRLDDDALIRDLSSLYQALFAILGSWENRWRHRSHCCDVLPIENSRVSTGQNDDLPQVGRPRIQVNNEQIECLRNLGFTWNVSNFGYVKRVENNTLAQVSRVRYMRRQVCQHK